MIKKYLTKQQLSFYNQNGYLKIENLLSPAEVEAYLDIYDQFLSGKIEVGANRSDLGADLGENKEVENITQIMWPSEFMPDLLKKAYHQRALAISKELMGVDAEMDFDMLINKAPGTKTITPWHQDEAYWLKVPDSRAASCWLALDQATKENGCLWFVPGSNLKEVRPHHFASKKGGALQCMASEDEAIAVELNPGSCTFHHGRTLHYSRGNSTSSQRRAFIINFRPQKMIEFEREQGFDHGKNNAADRQLKNENFK
jgi:phytanoyl-CoA hydroxylase